MKFLGRWIWIFLIVMGHIHADENRGYSIQILSRPIAQSSPFDMDRFDSSCYLVKRHGYEAVRCGCVDRMEEAKKVLLPKFKRKYRGAFVANCDKRAYRLHGTDTKKVVEKAQKTEHRKGSSRKIGRYSIQIVSVPKGREIKMYPSTFKDCYKVTRKKYDAIRCGCFDDFAVAKNKLKGFQTSFPGAFVANCDLEAYAKGDRAQNVVARRDANKTASPSKVRRKSVTSTKKGRKKPTLLDKIYLSFIYSGDLKHAKEVVDLGLRQKRDRIKWLRRGIDVAIWQGESQRAMNLMERLYRLTGDPKIGKKLIDYALNNRRYQQALYLMIQGRRSNWTPKDIDLVNYLYQQAGYPEKACDLLYKSWQKNPQQRRWLLDAIEIALNLGELDKAGQMIHDLEKIGIKTLRGAELASYYYFIIRKPQKAYLTLLSFNPNLLEKEEDKIAYYRRVSDLGWLVGDYKRAMEASLYLIRHGSSTREDYDRVLLVETREDPKVALEIAMEAFEKYKAEDYFFSAAYLAERVQDYDRLADLYSIVDEEHLQKEFAEKPDYYLLLSELDLYLKRRDAALQDLQKALEISPDNPRILSQMIWFYYDNEMTTPMKKIVAYIEANMQPLDPILYPALIAAHMKLQQSDLARFYIDRLYRHENKRLTFDEKAGLAYLLQQQMQMNYYKSMLLKLYGELERERVKDPKKLKDPKFVDVWLRSSMEFINPDLFQKRLKKAKKVLPKARYRQIEMLWNIRIAAYERYRKELYAWKESEPWMVLSLALYDHDLTTIQDLLYRKGDILPIRDRVLAARKDRQIALAQTFAFEGMETNRWDYLLFYQREQLMRAESDRYAVEGNWENRDSLSRSRYVLRNRNRLARGWSLAEKVQYVANGDVDHGKLRTVPKDQKGIDLSLKKRFDRGAVTLTGGYRDGMKNYAVGSIRGDWILMQRWHAAAGYYHHEDTEDTTYLMLGGYRDRAHLALDYKLLNSTTIQGHGDYMKYHGQDKESAGDGWKTGVSLYHVFRTGYPDIQFSLYSEYGRFNQRLDQKGVLRELMVHPEYETATPSDFFIVGGGLYVGYDNYSDYIRAWRWYGGISPYYDYESNEGSVGGELGVGGSLFQQDHLDLGIRYTPAFYNGQESLTTLYFLYRMMY